MSTSDAATLPASPPSPPLPLWFRWLRGYVRRELPAWGWLYGRCGGYDDTRFVGLGTRWSRDKLHGYEVELDLGNWSERLSHSLGRYHDLPLLLLLRALLRAGDTFVDVGANLGQVTLFARRLVGDTGRVFACEPNPRPRARLAARLLRNGLQDVEVLPVALSDSDGDGTLHEFDGHSGWGSLVAQAPAGAVASAAVAVQCVRGDRVLREQLDGRPSWIKIDVEGHELAVLRGLAETIAAHRPMLVVEVGAEHQRRAGHSLDELLLVLQDFGYRGLQPTVRRSLVGSGFGRRSRLELRPFRPELADGADVLFVPSDGPMLERVPA